MIYLPEISKTNAGDPGQASLITDKVVKQYNMVYSFDENVLTNCCTLEMVQILTLYVYFLFSESRKLFICLPACHDSTCFSGCII